MDEPTIYDFIISLFDRDKQIDLSPLHRKKIKRQKTNKANNKTFLHERNQAIRFIAGCFLAVSGQYFLEPDSKLYLLALVLYSLSIALIWPSIQIGQQIKQHQKRRAKQFRIRLPLLILSLGSQIIAFLLFRTHTFTPVNLFFWLTGIVSLTMAFWVFTPKKEEKKENVKTSFIVLMVIAIGISLFFRLYQIDGIPTEMYSDHAEKLLDVMDIINGKFPIYFERNTGREPIQFYVTALITYLFGTGFSFLSLKIGTIIFGLLTLPFIYLQAKEIGNRWVGLAAIFLAGIAYWPNVISRVGLRYSLYPLFAAPAMYFLFKGLRKNSQNLLVVSGLFIGFGLLGYSAFRIFPLYVILVMVISAVGEKNKININTAVSRLLIIGAIAFSAFLPLFRFWFDNPGLFSYRMTTRLTPVEKTFQSPALIIFLKNFIRSVLMPFLNNGHIWVHSITNRPALDFITAGFYFVGLIAMIKRAINEQSEAITGLLISIPILMLPSILSLAYPGENPSLNRSAGAYIPIFIVAGYGLFLLMQAFSRSLGRKTTKILVPFVLIIICGISIANNYQLVFGQYNKQFRQNAWNTSEIGEVISDFLAETVTPADAFVVPFAHWVDTRLVGFNAGYPGRDFALSREDLMVTQSDDKEKMFIYKPEDSETQSILQTIYPDGEISVYYSSISGKDFIIYTVLNN